MLREANELHRKRGNAWTISRRGRPWVLVLCLPVALLLSGCPKKPEVQTGRPAAVMAEPERAPAPEPREEIVVVEEREEVVIIEEAEELEDVFFDFDKSVIRPDARETLDDNLRWLRDNPRVRIVVEGHCDERGTNEYNLGLGERRAKAVRDYLVAGGIDSKRIATISYGEERPFCLGHDESAWQCNRRGHFVIAK